MASARKKLDDKNLKILREIVSQPGNKHCFDCNQRGPTYINMTIGSFVCTKCSGMLRGLTPPHRVKSISMATFTTEEVELVKSRGNNYCRQTWLGLYDDNKKQETKDEQEIKDFMIDKYERKRFYLDPSTNLRNGFTTSQISQTQTFHSNSIQKTPEIKTLKSALINNQLNKDLQMKNNFNTMKSNGSVNTNNGSDFVADFGSADIFNSARFNNNKNVNNNVTTNGTTQPSFANFENNPIYNSSTYQNQNSYDSYLNQMAQISSYITNVTNRSYTPMTSTFTNGTNSVPINSKPMKPPSEDKYAALKDLDNALKQQQTPENHIEWNGSSNGSGYNSSPQSGSLYGSPSTAGSMYGSPSQGFSAFPQQEIPSNNISNPFQRTQNVQNPWGTANTNTTVIANNFQTNFGANPFRTDSFNGVNNKFNGMTNGFNGNQMTTTQPFQQNIFPSSQPINFTNNKGWNAPNPFTLGVTPGAGGHSNNPFL